MSDEEETPNLPNEDAHDAGTEDGHRCTLILADGWTAAYVAVAGLSVTGRKRYGMHRLLNFTHEAKNKNISDIPEIKSLMEITGLQYNVDYSSEDQRKTLRYGKLMILTDHNVEGSNFKGLLIYFIYTYWPHLLRQNFLEEFLVPVVKVTRGDNKFLFFSYAEFEEWKLSIPDIHAYTVRHYLGVGTNTSNEVKEYFANIDSHRVSFKYSGPKDDENLIKAFDKDAITQRREWLSQHMDERKRGKWYGLQDNTNLYTGITKEVTFSDFINLEYVFFANFDNVRSIPSVVDGLKPGQRKLLFTCIQREDKSEIKVAQLACSVAERAAYYESEHTIVDIIYKMAQNYVGSNNINLLIPVGQFGTRLTGGEDRADHYYTLTVMSTLTRFIFHPHDDPLLVHNSSVANEKIEPKCYAPIIPMILVNGCEGIGTGWSTSIPKHNPHQLIRSLRNMIAGKMPDVLTPYYRNFRGTIHAIGDGRFLSIGCLALIEDEKVEITELPIGIWTASYKTNVLEPLLNDDGTTKPIITDYREYHTDTTVRFVISFAPGEFDKLRHEVFGFHRIFKLYGIIKTDNMYAFDSSNSLRRYKNANEILKEFYDHRLEDYVKRKKYLERKATAEADKLNNQVRFIVAKSDKTLTIENKERKTIITELIQLGYEPDPIAKWEQKMGIDIIEDEREEFQLLPSNEKTDAKNYDYLLSMSMWMLTEELKSQLIQKRDGKINDLLRLKEKSAYDLWLSDLDGLERKLNENEKADKVNIPDIEELHPSKNGKNVELNVTDEFVVKYCCE